MVSRIEFFCPGCGAPEVPELILREYYTCPTCEQTIPREKLDRQRRNNYLLAGSGPSAGAMAASVVGSGNFFDPTQATSTLTVSNCLFQAGDVCVVCIATNLSGGDCATNVVTVGGLGATEVDAGVTQSTDQFSQMFVRANISAGSKSVVLEEFAISPTAAAAIVLAVRGGALTGQPDKSKEGDGSTAAFDTGLTATLTSAGEMSIGMVGFELSDLVGQTVFSNGYTFLARAGTELGGPPSDTCLDVAFRALTSTAATKCSGTIASAVSWMARVATFSPL